MCVTYICTYNVTCLVEYQNCRTAFPKELGKGVSAVTDTKLVAAVTNL
jgi:hypothetical protein